MKVRKDYRFSQETLQKIDWLSDRLKINATQVMERAVEVLFEQQRAALRLRAVRREDGMYLIQTDGLPLVVINEAVLKEMGIYGEQLLGDGAEESVFGVIFLAAARAEKAHVEFHPENVERIYGPIVNAKGSALEGEMA
jgi:hypothetical protein